MKTRSIIIIIIIEFFKVAEVWKILLRPRRTRSSRRLQIMSCGEVAREGPQCDAMLNSVQYNRMADARALQFRRYSGGRYVASVACCRVHHWWRLVCSFILSKITVLHRTTYVALNHRDAMLWSWSTACSPLSSRRPWCSLSSTPARRVTNGARRYDHVTPSTAVCVAIMLRPTCVRPFAATRLGLRSVSIAQLLTRQSNFDAANFDICIVPLK